MRLYSGVLESATLSGRDAYPKKRATLPRSLRVHLTAQTPEDLIADGLYNALATAFMDGDDDRAVGRKLLARSIGAVVPRQAPSVLIHPIETLTASLNAVVSSRRWSDKLAQVRISFRTSS